VRSHSFSSLLLPLTNPLALLSPSSFPPADLDSYAKITGQDLSGPVPEDPMDKINQLRDEQDALERDGGRRPDHHGKKRKGAGAGGKDIAPLKKRKKGDPVDERGAALFDEPEADEDDIDPDMARMREEMEEEDRQRRIDEQEAAMAGL
jgi:transcription factor TFIIIB component B''